MSKRNISTMPAPKKLVQPSSNGMPPPPPPISSMPPPPPKFNSPMPPPPPKFKSPAQPPASKVNSSVPVQDVNKNNKIVKVSDPKIVPDTLISLMEYGDEDEDDDPEDTDEGEGGLTNQSSGSRGPKPFWAV